MEISAQLVKELRERTGAGLMECKHALTETAGNVETAIKYLKEKGILKAAKKSGRETKEGLICISISEDGKNGIIAEINCETDFVARNSEFVKETQSISDKILKSNATSADNVSDDIQNNVKALIAKLGENMAITRVKRINSQSGFLTSYLHQGGQIGVLLHLGLGNKDSYSNSDFTALAKNVSMHIAAMSPLALKAEEIDPQVVKEQEGIATKQAKESGKPDNVIPKIVEGKMKQFFKDSVLLEQAFVKDPKLSVKAYIDTESKKFNDQVQIVEFIRFKIGE